MSGFAWRLLLTCAVCVQGPWGAGLRWVCARKSLRVFGPGCSGAEPLLLLFIGVGLAVLPFWPPAASEFAPADGALGDGPPVFGDRVAGLCEVAACDPPPAAPVWAPATFARDDRHTIAMAAVR